MTTNPSRALGDLIAQLRTKYQLSRTRLAMRIARQLADDSDLHNQVSDIWIKRLEGGLRVKVTRPMIEAIAKALTCTPRERGRLLLLADKNILGADAAHDPDAEALALTVAMLYDEARPIIASLLDQRRAADLTDAELRAIAAEAIRLVADRKA